jgi:predicted Zn-dependent protease
MKHLTIIFIALILLLATSNGRAQSDDLALKSHQAKQLMAEGKFGQAISLYRELNQAVPNNPGLMLNLGMALHMAGNEREAIPRLEAVIKLDPTAAPAWLFLGAARLQMGQPAAALKPLETFLGLQSDHLEARSMLASALLSLGRLEEAAEQYRHLTKFHPESAQAWYGLGQCYETLAARTFDELQKAAPESAYWLALVAETRAREQQLSSAFYLYRQALQKSPGMRGLHAAIANIYRQTGHPDWAENEERKEQQLPPPDCRAHAIQCNFHAMGHAEFIASSRPGKTVESHYWRSRAYNELALGAFTRLGELPRSPEAHQLKARIYSEQKRYSEAAGEWREALKLSPADSEIQKQLAISLKLGQDYGGALPLLQGLLKRQPMSAELNYLVGDTLLDLQRVEEALPHLKRAVSRNPKLVAAHKSLARAELAAGNTTEAIPHLKVALTSDEDGSLHYQLATAYRANGQSELAKQTLAEYEKIQREAQSTRESAKREVEITPP